MNAVIVFFIVMGSSLAVAALWAIALTLDRILKVLEDQQEDPE